MMLTAARQAEIVRSNQKDDFYLSFLRGSVASIVQSMFGPHLWLHWRKELDLVADLAYFSLTTLAGYQTLGEEYVNVIQVDASRRKIPSHFRRVFMVFIHVAAPYLIDNVLERVERRAERPNASSELRRFASVVPALRNVTAIVHRCHLAFFYLRGVFYHVAKRLVGIHYLQIRRGSSAVSQSNYRILGVLSLVQILFAFARHVYKRIQQSDNSLDSGFIASLFALSPAMKRDTSAETDEEFPSADNRFKCSLCLEGRKNSTATPCGHVFCWNCIIEWCNTKAECPLCREQFVTSRLIPLQNYDSL